MARTRQYTGIEFRISHPADDPELIQKQQSKWEEPWYGRCKYPWIAEFRGRASDLKGSSKLKLRELRQLERGDVIRLDRLGMLMWASWHSPFLQEVSGNYRIAARAEKDEIEIGGPVDRSGIILPGVAYLLEPLVSSNREKYHQLEGEEQRIAYHMLRAYAIHERTTDLSSFMDRLPPRYSNFTGEVVGMIGKVNIWVEDPENVRTTLSGEHQI